VFVEPPLYASYGTKSPFHMSGIKVMDELDNPAGELIMLVSRTPDAVLSMINTSAVECNAAGNTPHQSAAFYLSVLANLFPGLLPLAKEVLRETGYTVIEVTEDTAAEYVITLQGWINFPTALAIFGQFALSYARSMQSRANALKSMAGVWGDLVPGGGDILLSISTAKNIRSIVGGNDTFRAELLKIILGNRDGIDRLNVVCAHLADIISWTEMTPMKFMFESLCLPNSPVLRDSRVKNEVINLCDAHKRINETPYPQYYRILHPTQARVILPRSRFATLAEVARRYLSEENSRVRQYAASSNSQNDTLAKRIAVHNGVVPAKEKKLPASSPMMEKYEPLKELGSGNFGVARLVRDKRTKQLLAVKYIERGSKIDENVQREIINHRSLRHPNIIRFKEVFLTPTHLAIVMEYAAGGELFGQICNAGRFSEDEARFFFQQLISGVSYCHAMEICHRDLKLENTLLDGSRTPRLKICDFGYSKSGLLHSQPKSKVGTPAYIAPEVISRKEYDGKELTLLRIPETLEISVTQLG
ncbi:hypothetical protein M8C21_014032, partial [Ambrosia artemisiifolia]